MKNKILMYWLLIILFFTLAVVCCYFGYTSGRELFSGVENIGNKNLFITMIAIAFISILLVFCFLAMLLVTKNRTKINDLNIRLKKWTEISYHINKAGDEVFNSLPVGILIYDNDYISSWANHYIDDIFGFKVSESPSRLDKLSDDIYKNVLESKNQFTIEYDDKNYDIVQNKNNRTLYFFDVTERENLKKRYNARVMAIGIIGLDNLDDFLKTYDMKEKAEIRGSILGAISKYANEHSCYLQTLSDDRMMITFDRENLDKMIEDKFSFINNIRAISNENHLMASISMGIGCWDLDSLSLGEIAQNALDLAEKRGGDQIVVNIEGEKIKYFGGSLNSQEKNTLVEVRRQALAFKSDIESSDNVLIMCHNFADCDAIGSMIAVYHLAIASGKEAKMIFDPNRADVTVKKIYSRIKKDDSLSAAFVSPEEAMNNMITQNTLLIITDTQSPKMVMFPEIFKLIPKYSVIDHHRAGNPGYEKYSNYYVETSASSAVELVTEMFQFYTPKKDGNQLDQEIYGRNQLDNQNKITVSPLEASIMLAGIIVDTNNFTVRSGVRTFQAAGELKDMGADMIFVRKLLQENIEIERVLAQALMNVEIFGERFAIVCLDDSVKIQDRTTLAKISDKQLTIEGVEASFTIGKIEDDLYGISARSLGDGINVQSIMEMMGGGGHFNSAAMQTKEKNALELKADLEEILKLEYIEGGDGKMKVILLADVKGKGLKDQIIEVSNGYGNYLLINKLAEQATPENMKEFNERKEKEKEEAKNRRALLERLKDDIQDKTIVIQIKVGPNGKSFGHITTKQISEEFERQAGIVIDKQKLEISADINSVGMYTVNAKIDTDIIASFTVKVVEK